MRIERIALFGAGATGTIMGSLIAKAGLDITLVGRNEEHVRALQERGAKITGGLDLRIPVKAVLTRKLRGSFDLIIYAVKSTADQEALPKVARHLRESSVVLTTQNGVPEETVASYVGSDRTLGGTIAWTAETKGPGVVCLVGDPKNMMYRIGELDGSITPRLREVQEVLGNAGTVELAENLAGMRWTKLLINVSMSGLSAALGCTFGEILDDEKAIDTALALTLEVFQTAHKLGVRIEQIHGTSAEHFLALAQTDKEAARGAIRSLFSAQRAGKPSMLQDLEKGRLTEVESINGYLSRKSREANVPAPVNDSVVDIIRGIQEGRFKLTMKNLDRIELPPLPQVLA